MTMATLLDATMDPRAYSTNTPAAVKAVLDLLPRWDGHMKDLSTAQRARLLELVKP